LKNYTSLKEALQQTFSELNFSGKGRLKRKNAARAKKYSNTKSYTKVLSDPTNIGRMRKIVECFSMTWPGQGDSIPWWARIGMP